MLNSRDVVDPIKQFEDEMSALLTNLHAFTLSYQDAKSDIKEEKVSVPILFIPLNTGIGLELRNYLYKEYNLEPLIAGQRLVSICQNFDAAPHNSDQERKARIEEAKLAMQTFAWKHCLTDKQKAEKDPAKFALEEKQTQKGSEEELNFSGEAAQDIRAHYTNPIPSMFDEVVRTGIKNVLGDPLPRFLLWRKSADYLLETIKNEMQSARTAISTYQKDYAAQRNKTLFLRFLPDSDSAKKIAKLDNKLDELQKLITLKNVTEIEQKLNHLRDKYRLKLLNIRPFTHELQKLTHALSPITAVARASQQLDLPSSTTTSVGATLRHAFAARIATLHRPKTHHGRTASIFSTASTESSTSSTSSASSTSSIVSGSNTISASSTVTHTETIRPKASASISFLRRSSHNPPATVQPSKPALPGAQKQRNHSTDFATTSMISDAITDKSFSKGL